MLTFRSLIMRSLQNLKVSSETFYSSMGPEAHNTPDPKTVKASTGNSPRLPPLPTRLVATGVGDFCHAVSNCHGNAGALGQTGSRNRIFKGKGWTGFRM